MYSNRLQFKALRLYITAEIKPTPVRTCDLGELTFYQQLYCYLKIPHRQMFRSQLLLQTKNSFTPMKEQCASHPYVVRAERGSMWGSVCLVALGGLV